MTNVPPEKLAAEDIGPGYSLRRQIEMLFKHFKTHDQIEDMPSGKRVVVDALLYAAFLTMLVSRRLLALLRRQLAAMADRIPERRWAAVFVSVAHEILAAAIRPLSSVRLLLRHVDKVLLHEAVDPNAARHGPLASAICARTVFTTWPPRHEARARSRGWTSQGDHAWTPIGSLTVTKRPGSSLSS
jgi:hypothetical protein